MTNLHELSDAITLVLEAIKSAIPGIEYGFEEATGELTIKVDDEGSKMLEALSEKSDIPWLVEVLKHIKIVRLRSRAPGGSLKHEK